MGGGFGHEDRRRGMAQGEKGTRWEAGWGSVGQESGLTGLGAPGAKAGCLTHCCLLRTKDGAWGVA